MTVATQVISGMGFETRFVCFWSPVCAVAGSCFNQIPDATVTVTTVCAGKVLNLPDFAEASILAFCELSGSRNRRGRSDHHQLSGLGKQREEGERERERG